MRNTFLFAAKACAVALIAVLLVGMSFAQTSNGTIAGTVTDPTGAAVPNAKVTVTAVATGITANTTTSGIGAFRVESLIPGTYTVTIAAPSFATTKLVDVQVGASVVTSLNATMKPGQASETVNVEAQAETLQTESGEISHTLSTAEVSKLPVSSLNAYALATTLPGVMTTSSSVKMTNGTEFAVNGTRPRANNFLIEGQDNNDAGIHGQGLQPQNLDAVKEVSILTNSYAPEFGNGGGSVNNLIFKSGTNAFHGAAWEQHLNSALNANDHYNNLTGSQKGRFDENIFGFDIGGPIKKDKAFFFVSHQWDKYRANSTSSRMTLPTDAGIAALNQVLALPSCTVYAPGCITATQKSQINTLLKAYGSNRGLPGQGTLTRLLALGDNRPAVEVGPFTRTGIPDSSNSAEFVAKTDFTLTQNDTLNFRYVRSAGTWPYDTYNYPAQLPGFDNMQYGASHNAGITYAHVFSPKVVNEARVSYGRIGFTFDFRPETYANPLALAPTTSVSGLTGWGAPGGNPQGRFHNTMQYQDSLSWNTGSHSFKFGTDIADIRVRDAVPFNFYGSIGYADGGGYSGLANFIDSFGGTNSQATITYGSPVIHPKLFQQAYFMQDTWKIRPNFTLTYGVRYENSGTPADTLKYPAADILDLSVANYLKVIPEQRDNNNFGPRVGIAYTPRFGQKLFGDNKTVIRAGFGMFYDGMFTNILDNSAAYSPNAVAPALTSPGTSTSRGTANWNNSIIATLSPTPSPTALSYPIAYNLRNPETYQWNFDIQRDLPANFTLTTGYVGTRSTHQFVNTEANALVNGVRRVTGRGRVIMRTNEGDSNYNALNVKLDRRFSHGLQLRGAYTWAKMIDTGSEVFTGGNYSSYPIVQYPNPRSTFDRGLSAFDRRQALAITYIYDLPKFKAPSLKENPFMAVAGQVANGWELSGTTRFQTGAPGNPQIGTDWNGDGISNDRPMVGNPNAPLTSWAVQDSASPTGWCEGNTWWYVTSAQYCSASSAVDPNSVHWLVPDYGTQGKRPVYRNSYTLPGLQTWTIAATKSFKLAERQTLQFRLEMFNPFNHANTGIPALTLIDNSWTGSTSHICAIEPNYVSSTGVKCGKEGTSGFGNLGNTIGGYRDMRMMIKYVF